MTKKERELKYEIECIEKVISSKREMGKDTTLKEELLKKFKKYLPRGSKYHMWLRPTMLTKGK